MVFLCPSFAMPCDPSSREARGVVELTYLIRYGVMGHIGRFRGHPRCGGPFDRGQAVVIQSHRGMEFGEVLVLLDDETAAPGRWGEVEPATGEDASPIGGRRAARSSCGVL